MTGRVLHPGADHTESEMQADVYEGMSQRDIDILERLRARYATADEMLRAAVDLKSAGVLGALVKMGASIGSISKVGRSALHFAAKRKRLDACRVLVALGADPNYSPPNVWDRPDGVIAVPKGDDYRRTPFEMAVSFGAEEVVSFFVLECGCSLTARGATGKTPIQLAYADESMKALLRSLKSMRIVGDSVPDTADVVEARPAQRSLAPL